MNKQIKLTYKGKDYMLEYNRKAVADLERMGFIASELGTKPALMLPLAFRGAFLKNHKFVDTKIIEEIYDNVNDKEKLLSTIGDMIVECYESLMNTEKGKEDVEGNASWEIV